MILAQAAQHNGLLTIPQKYGVEHNLVTRLRGLGLSMQEAVDRARTMLDECFIKWHKARAEIPSWGGIIDENVLRLLGVYRDVALGTLHWR